MNFIRWPNVRRGSNFPVQVKAERVWNQRISPVAVRPGEGPLTERTAVVRLAWREQVVMPHIRRSQYLPRSAQSGPVADRPDAGTTEARESKFGGRRRDRRKRCVSVSRWRQPVASTASCSGRGQFALPQPVERAILASKPPGIWRISANQGRKGIMRSLSLALAALAALSISVTSRAGTEENADEFMELHKVEIAFHEAGST